MQKLPHIPRVANKYALTINDIKNLRVGRHDLINPNLFWWNNLCSAWFIFGVDDSKMEDANCNEYWITIYDEKAPRNAGKFTFKITRSSGVHPYSFEEFYNPKDIESKNDLVIQEKFLNTINQLIDMGILVRT